MFNSNCHTHTNYCDGKNTAEEMVLGAIKLGYKSLGFSGHSPMSFESVWGMKKEDVDAYCSEIRALSEKYADKIEIILGMELDSYVDLDDKSMLDYTIGSVHEITADGKCFDIDNTREIFDDCCQKYFGGDYNRLAEFYYNELFKFVRSEKPDVVGHYDLIEKFNDKKELFDYENPEYQTIALKYVDKILEACPNVIFEVNTGAMFRCGNSEPYPRFFILKHLAEKGAGITITSDAHCPEALDFAFEKAEEYCRNAGYKEVYMLRKGGFEKFTL